MDFKEFEDIINKYICSFPDFDIQLNLITKMIVTQFGSIERRYCYTAFMFNKKTVNGKNRFYGSNYFKEGNIQDLKAKLIEDIENFIEDK